MQRKNFFSSTFWLGINCLYIAAKREFFLLFSIYWTRKEKGHKTVGNFSQTSFRSGTRPLLSNNASPSLNIIHVGLGIRLRRVIKIYDNNKHTLNMLSKKYIKDQFNHQQVYDKYNSYYTSPINITHHFVLPQINPWKHFEKKTNHV